MSKSDNVGLILGPHSPPSPEIEMTKKSSRRSSVAAARRLSRASTMAGGIPFEVLAVIGYACYTVYGYQCLEYIVLGLVGHSKVQYLSFLTTFMLLSFA